MRIYILIIAGLISTAARGQESQRDSVFYALTLRTIEDFRKIRLVKTVSIPTLFWNSRENRPLTGNYFNESDLDFISDQINNPAFKTWNVERFRKNKNVKLINKPKNKECLLVSLPIVSADLKTIVIYYETWSKPFLREESSGAGFAVVWRRNQSNSWTQDNVKMLWITNLRVPTHNIIYKSYAGSLCYHRFCK